MYISEMENAGISTGKPPACQTPRLTDSSWYPSSLISKRDADGSRGANHAAPRINQARFTDGLIDRN